LQSGSPIDTDSDTDPDPDKKQYGSGLSGFGPNNKRRGLPLATTPLFISTG